MQKVSEEGISDLDLMKKPIRVWSRDRQQKYGMVVGSLEEIIQKGAIKLSLPNDVQLNVVLEEDGTIVDNCYWKTLPPHSRVMLLLPGESWRPPRMPLPQPINTDETDAKDDETREKERASSLFKLLLENPASVAMMKLVDLEMIKDADVFMFGFSVDDAQQLTDLKDVCVEFYVKRKQECEALQFLELLKANSKSD